MLSESEFDKFRKCHECHSPIKYDHEYKINICGDEEGNMFVFNCTSCSLPHYFEVPDYELDDIQVLFKE